MKRANFPPLQRQGVRFFGLGSSIFPIEFLIIIARPFHEYIDPTRRKQLHDAFINEAYISNVFHRQHRIPRLLKPSYTILLCAMEVTVRAEAGYVIWPS